MAMAMAMAMAGSTTTTLLHLVVIFLGFSHLFCFNNAIPVTRTGRLLHGPQVLPLEETNHMVAKEESLDHQHMNLDNGRMAVQLNDYPGSGANHHHTPWPPQMGRCADC